jgi:hypothetical protein
MLLCGATETSAASGAAKAAVAKSTIAASERDHETFSNPNHQQGSKQIHFDWNLSLSRLFGLCPNTGRTDNLVVTMKKILLATVATLALAAPSFAAEPEKTVGQAPQSFYLAQDTATMKCEIVETQPLAGSKVKVVGAAHATKAAAETALKADKSCAN